MSDSGTMPDWEKVLSAAARLQQIIPEAVLVGGTAAAAHARHRHSRDADHVLTDLRGRFDQVLRDLESVAGWKTARVNRPLLILGSLDGIETGIRQLIRETPLETITLDLPGARITLPTAQEMLRIKAVLILKRNATRDYLDFAALADRLGPDAAVAALAPLDTLYPQANAESVIQQLQVQLAAPAPYDLDDLRLDEYRNLDPKWHDWTTVRSACAAMAVALTRTWDSTP